MPHPVSTSPVGHCTFPYMDEEKPNEPEVPLPSTEASPLSDVVKNTLLGLADWQEVTERIKARVRTSKLKLPHKPPDIIS